MTASGLRCWWNSPLSEFDELSFRQPYGDPTLDSLDLPPEEDEDSPLGLDLEAAAETVSVGQEDKLRVSNPSASVSSTTSPSTSTAAAPITTDGNACNVISISGFGNSSSATSGGLSGEQLQTLVVNAWLAVREASGVLGAILERVPLPREGSALHQARPSVFVHFSRSR